MRAFAILVLLGFAGCASAAPIKQLQAISLKEGSDASSYVSIRSGLVEEYKKQKPGNVLDYFYFVGIHPSSENLPYPGLQYEEVGNYFEWASADAAKDFNAWFQQQAGYNSTFNWINATYRVLSA